MWRPDHSHGPIILLDYNLGALPDFFQDGVQITCQFSLGDVDLRHIFDHTSSRCSTAVWLRRLVDDQRIELAAWGIEDVQRNRTCEVFGVEIDHVADVGLSVFES